MVFKLLPSCSPVNPENFWGGVWYNSLKPALVYTTPKEVTLTDWRLGLTLRILQLVIFLYVLYNVYSEQAFLQIEIPSGSVTIWTTPDGHMASARRDLFIQGIDGGSTRCTEARDYSFEYSDSFTYNIAECWWATEAEVARTGSEQLFVTTHRQQTVASRAAASATNMADPSTCSARLEAAGLACSSGTATWTEGPGYGWCQCQYSRDFIAAAPENITVEFTHTYTTANSGSGDTPRTVLRRKGSEENLRVYERGTAVKFALWEWLELLEVDLDAALDQGSNRQWVAHQLSAANTSEPLQGPRGVQAGTFPRARVSGVQLDVSLEYYNFEQEPSGANNDVKFKNLESLYDNQVLALMVVHPKLTWTSRGHDVSQAPLAMSGAAGATTESIVDNYDYGVKFQFTSTGSVSHFSYPQLIAAITSGIVLVGVANSVVRMLAMYGMGLKSPFFADAVNEKVSFKNDYARFGAQMIAAVSLFDDMDVDRSDQLDRFELYRILRQVTLTSRESRMGAAETMSLVGFLMSESERDDEDQAKAAFLQYRAHKSGQPPPRKAQGKTSLEEWVEAFCSPPCNLTTFVNYINEKRRRGLYKVDEAELALLKDVDKALMEDLKITTGGKIVSKAGPLSYGGGRLKAALSKNAVAPHGGDEASGPTSQPVNTSHGGKFSLAKEHALEDKIVNKAIDRIQKDQPYLAGVPALVESPGHAVPDPEPQPKPPIIEASPRLLPSLLETTEWTNHARMIHEAQQFRAQVRAAQQGDPNRFKKSINWMDVPSKQGGHKI